MAKFSDLEAFHNLLDHLISETEKSNKSPYDHEDWKTISNEFTKALDEAESLINRSILNCDPTEYTNDHVFRAIKMQYQNTPLSWEGSQYGHGRFHAKGQPTLYFAEQVETIAREIPQFNFKNYQHAQFPAKISLNKIFDCANPDQTKILFGFKKYLRHEWGCYVDIYLQKPVTHIISDVLRRHGYEAIRFESRIDGNFNLAVFPKNLADGSKIEIIDPQPDQSPTELHSGNLNLFA